jgi:hypothetical protein
MPHYQPIETLRPSLASQGRPRRAISLKSVLSRIIIRRTLNLVAFSGLQNQPRIISGGDRWLESAPFEP